MVTQTDPTVLRLWGIGVPPYSARGLRQTLTPIAASQQIRRTVNGGLIDLSHAQFRKYASTITGNDQRPPGVDGIWPGQQVTVDCIQELAYPEYDGGNAREEVPGSKHQEAGWWFYRPRLHMVVQSFSVETDEYGATVGWTMELEEE
jgi:hypothetical protein